LPHANTFSPSSSVALLRARSKVIGKHTGYQKCRFRLDVVDDG
jgi:hypothetical protein